VHDDLNADVLRQLAAGGTNLIALRSAVFNHVDAAEAEIMSLHCPLMPETHHIINEASLEQIQDGVMLINTSHGAMFDTVVVIAALKSGHLGY
jgi:lactate dehydrogenase-like 2-hydroxyacid dehydrogenase